MTLVAALRVKRPRAWLWMVSTAPMTTSGAVALTVGIRCRMPAMSVSILVRSKATACSITMSSLREMVPGSPACAAPARTKYRPMSRAIMLRQCAPRASDWMAVAAATWPPNGRFNADRVGVPWAYAAGIDAMPNTTALAAFEEGALSVKGRCNSAPDAT